MNLCADKLGFQFKGEAFSPEAESETSMETFYTIIFLLFSG